MIYTALDEDELENNLIQKGKNQATGAVYYLDPTYLPQLQCKIFYEEYIIQDLNSQEKACLDEFQLQNLLIELTFNRPKKVDELYALKQYILHEIRLRENYWIKGSLIYQNLTQNITQIDKKNLDKFNKYSQQIDELKKHIEQYKFVRDEKSQQQNENEIQEIFQYLEDIQSYDDYGKRVTRQQKNKVYNDENQQKVISVEYSNNPFYPVRAKKYNRLEFQLFPYIYLFICQKKQIDEKKSFKLQNFLLFLLMTENPQTISKVNNHFLKDQNNESNGSTSLANSKVDMKSHYQNFPLLKSFDEFCFQNVIFLLRISCSINYFPQIVIYQEKD